MFQANAIQFGLDQLLEAPTSKLICFHPLVLLGSECWQFNLAFFYVATSSVLILDVTDEKTNGTISKFLNGNVDNAIFVVVFLFQ